MKSFITAISTDKVAYKKTQVIDFSKIFNSAIRKSLHEGNGALNLI